MASTASALIINRVVNIDGLYQQAGALNNASQAALGRHVHQYALGDGPGQANIVWNNGGAPVLLNAAAVHYDMFGALTDAFGQSVNLTKIREIIVRNLSRLESDVLTMSGNLFGAFGADIAGKTLKGGEVWHESSPYIGFTVTNTTQERLTLDPGAGSFAVAVFVLGVN